MNKYAIILVLLLLNCSCVPNQEPRVAKLPSLAYSDWAKAQQNQATIARQRENLIAQRRDASINGAARAQLRLVSDSLENGYAPAAQYINSNNDYITNDGVDLSDEIEIRPSMNQVRPYQGPLGYSETGTSPSLWQENYRANDLWRDDRAWQPMDLITVVVSESASGSKEGDTEIKGKSTVVSSIAEWLGIIDSIKKKNKQISDDSGNLVSANSQNNYKGEGEVTRKDTLTAKISAMVVEVLPGNVLRIEGEKIISLNQEEQTIAISGLVRPRDINSYNEVDSSKIANLRIDYYGRGVVSEAQLGGWFSRLMRVLWPF